MADLNTMYPSDTVGLMEKYISGIKEEHGKNARKRVFADFYEATHKDLLRADLKTLEDYCSHLAEKVRRGTFKNNTAIKERKIIAAFLSWCMQQKESGNNDVPDGFTNNMLSIKSAEIGEEYHFNRIPSMSDISSLVGWLKENDRQILTAVMLSMKCFLKTGEILKLRCDNFAREDGGKLFIVPDKGDRHNLIIKVPEDIINLISEQISISQAKYPDEENVWLFPSKISKGKKHCSEQWLSKKLKKACAEVGAKEVTFNSVKNLGAINAVSNGADVEKLNDSMGYKSRAHIKRLTSLNLQFDTVGADYVHISLKKDAVNT